MKSVSVYEGLLYEEQNDALNAALKAAEYILNNRTNHADRTEYFYRRELAMAFRLLSGATEFQSCVEEARQMRQAGKGALP